MTTFNIGIIGVGMLGRNLARCFVDDARARIVWTSDVIEAAARNAAEEFSGAKWTLDYREVLADPTVDAVAIATPPYLHAQHFVDAVAAGKHVLLEKPMAESPANVARIVQAAAQAPELIILEASGRHARLTPKFRFIKAFIASGKLGQVYHIHHNHLGRSTFIEYNPQGTWAMNKRLSGDGPRRDRYGWSFFDRLGHGNIREFMDDYLPHYQATRQNGHIALFSGNHDHCPRLGRGRDADDLTLIFLFLMTMPGTPFIYYGDEIGMPGIQGLPSKEGGYNRTQLRTPMQWDDSPNAGFSTAPAEMLYLPVQTEPNRPTVAAQESDLNSLLNRVRALIALRKQHPALWASAAFEPLYAEAGRYPLVYRRQGTGETLLIALNPSERNVEISLPMDICPDPNWPKDVYGLSNPWMRRGEDEWVLTMPPVSGGIYQV